MKAVAGTVLSSETISLRRATSIISNFASAETGAPPEVVAYSRRASKAFNELLQLHRDIKASGNARITPHAIPPEEPPRAERKPGGEVPNGDAIDRERDERRKKKKIKMELPAEVKAELAEVKVELMGAISKEGKRMKDKKMNQIPEKSRVLVKEEELGSKERKKEKKRNRETESVDEERMNKDGKKRKHFDAEVEGKGLGDSSDRSEQHKKKKRRKESQ